MSSEMLESTHTLRPRLTPLQPVYAAENSDGSDADNDIYRGERPPSIRPSTSTSTHTSSSSSSSSSFARGRLEALAAVVEHAITRWARGNSSSSSGSSSSSSSSSSLRSSIATLSRPSVSQRRRRRRSSVTSLQTLSSEKNIAARITRMKALAESRQIPRHFILYLPPSLRVGRASRRTARESGDDHDTQRVTHTASLSLVLGQLDFALKRATKARRHLGRGLSTTPQQPIPRLHRHYMAPDVDNSPGLSSIVSHPPRGKKGKQRARSGGRKHHVQFDQPSSRISKAWFLDVASPTWEDLRAIGKLLHLHPLTLEDILQQDPREKLDLFPKLGYYFISFRAIETPEVREKSQRHLQKMNEYLEPIAGHGEGAVGEANIYLVVFNEGICCFHYTDIAEHTDRVRNRITLFEEVTNMSSDWIAHGILDSIVDSFFPYLEEIEKEVMAIEALVFASTSMNELQPPVAPETKIFPRNSSWSSVKEEKPKQSLLNVTESLSWNEKSPSIGGNKRPRFASPQWTLPLLIRRVRRFFTKRWKHVPTPSQPPPSATTLTLRRMARVRRLVTSLSRLLASKSDVVTQIRKRLLKAGASGLGGRTSKGEEVEVAIYMGDVQDHILTLQHSLTHYERILSQSHPTYLSQLRTTFATSKSGTDKALIYLTTVSIAVLCIQTVIGSFSMNVNVPHNALGVYNVFGIVLSVALMVLCGYLSLVRYWWEQAKGRRAIL